MGARPNPVGNFRGKVQPHPAPHSRPSRTSTAPHPPPAAKPQRGRAQVCPAEPRRRAQVCPIESRTTGAEESSDKNLRATARAAPYGAQSNCAEKTTARRQKKYDNPVPRGAPPTMWAEQKPATGAQPRAAGRKLVRKALPSAAHPRRGATPPRGNTVARRTPARGAFRRKVGKKSQRGRKEKGREKKNSLQEGKKVLS